MRFRAKAALALALIAALGVRSAWAAPSQRADELRALSHCMAHDGRATSVPAARHCCSIEERADDPASLQAAMPEVPPPSFVALPLDHSVATPTPSGAVAIAASPAPPGGPPRRILLCSLQR